MSERLAFSIKSTTPKREIAYNLAALATEASLNKQLTDRVWHFTLQETDNHRVINPELSRDDVMIYYQTRPESTQLDRLEAAAGIEMRNALIRVTPTDRQTLLVWLSPPMSGYYNEARLVIGLVSIDEKGLRRLDTYGIPAKLDYSQCDFIARRLNEVSENNKPNINEEVIRRQTFTLRVPENKDPWTYINTLVPLEDIWQSIANGSVQQNNTKTKNIASSVVGRFSNGFTPSQRSHDHLIYFGAILEQEMFSHGFQLSDGPCGLLNSTILSGRNYFPGLNTLQSFEIFRGSGQKIEDEHGELNFTCDGCGEVNVRPFGVLLEKCQHCHKEFTACGPKS